MSTILARLRFFTAIAVLGLCAHASAASFSVSGPGGTIINPVTPSTWNVNWTNFSFTSTVSVPHAVTGLTAVKLGGLQQAWRGDLHIILRDPAGAAYNLVVRPGSNGSTLGDSGDYNFGDYTFVDSGGGTVLQGSLNIAPGTYNLYFNIGSGQWTNGIASSALSAITGPAGTWTLEIRDWAHHAFDFGSLTGWTLEGTDVSNGPFTAFCGAGDPAVTQPCQGAAGAPGAGCENSAATGGATLSAVGDPVADTHVLTSSGELASAFSVFLQSTGTLPSGAAFGDGVLCLSGNLKRMYIKPASGGVVSAPVGTDPSIQTRSAELGDPIAPGTLRSYQVYYRDPASVSGLNFNVSSAILVRY